MNSVHKVLFFNGQSKVIADILFEKVPEGFDGFWKPQESFARQPRAWLPVTDQF